MTLAEVIVLKWVAIVYLSIFVATAGAGGMWAILWPLNALCVFLDALRRDMEDHPVDLTRRTKN